MCSMLLVNYLSKNCSWPRISNSVWQGTKFFGLFLMTTNPCFITFEIKNHWMPLMDMDMVLMAMAPSSNTQGGINCTFVQLWHICILSESNCKLAMHDSTNWHVKVYPMLTWFFFLVAPWLWLKVAMEDQ